MLDVDARLRVAQEAAVTPRTCRKDLAEDGERRLGRRVGADVQSRRPRDALECLLLDVDRSVEHVDVPAPERKQFAETEHQAIDIYVARDLLPEEKAALEKRLTRASTQSTIYIMLSKAEGTAQL